MSHPPQSQDQLIKISIGGCKGKANHFVTNFGQHVTFDSYRRPPLYRPLANGATPSPPCPDPDFAQVPTTCNKPQLPDTLNELHLHMPSTQHSTHEKRGKFKAHPAHRTVDGRRHRKLLNHEPRWLRSCCKLIRHASWGARRKVTKELQPSSPPPPFSGPCQSTAEPNKSRWCKGECA